MFVNTAARVFIPILMGVLLISLSQPLFGDDYVGRSQCVNCHEEQVSQWQGSHHDLAMQPATPETVLGNFDNATYSHFGVISKFYRRDGQFYVRTDGPDGTLIEYKVKYTFGISPLQQYLVEFPNGKLQGLHIAWDSRPETQGGQHWFHLYPDENITHDDPLHWTGPSQNWNFMCADCHSTGLVKNYDLDTRSYQTTWSEIDVSCEACHGPGTQHVQWAQREDRDSIDNGLKVMLNERAEWSINQQTGLAKRVSKPSPMLQVETCGRCHARRSPLDKDYQHGRSLLHTHRIQTLQEDLYFPDGQIKDEVYVYGSFIQSKMYTKGVVCSDCHEPHSLQLRAEGNAVCASCHLQSTFDTEQHHFHKAGTDGAQCVNCHMPSRTYMVIDERRDHSFRIPRPDLSDQLGTPDVCTSCHRGRTPDWAASVIKTQWGGQAAERPHFGVAIHAGQNGALDAENQLMALAQNPNQPSIARASAVQLLQNYISPLSLPTIQALTRDPNPLIRVNALTALAGLDINTRISAASALLNDSTRTVRIEAARLLAGAPVDALDDAHHLRLGDAIDEYMESQLLNADRAESHINLGNLYASMGDLEYAELEYQQAIDINANYIPAYVNLADLFRAQNRDDKGKLLLEGIIEKFPEIGSLHYSYGLLLVRQKQIEKALAALKKAVDLESTNTRYRYIYAVALQSVGNISDAIDQLKQAHDLFPADRDVLIALITYLQQIGDTKGSRYYAEILLKIAPWDTGVQSLLQRSGS